MRWLPLVVLAGCSFPHGSPPLTTDARTSDDDGSIVMDPDAGLPEIDAQPPDPRRVRAIAVSGAQVIGGPHASFPLLVSLSETWLRPRANGGDVNRADGFDIFFSSDQAGAMKLAHEVESYVPASGELIAWVKVPSLTASTTIYIHYGDPALTTDPQNVAAVWSANYQGVFHLDSVADATGKNTAAGAVTSGSVAGRIDMARSLDGADDLIDLGSAGAIDNLFAGGGTAEAWFYATTWGESSHGRIFDKGHDNGWSLWVDNVEVQQSIGFLHGGGGNSWGFWSSPAQSVTLNAWHHVAVVYNKNTSGNNATIFLDGTAVTTTRIDNPNGTMDDDSSQSLGAGNRSATDRAFEGMLDELRLSSTSRSAGWIETEVRNQSNPGAFYTVSAPL